MLKNRRKAFKPTIDRLDSIVLPSNVPFAFLGSNLAQTALITSQGVYDTTTATFYVVPSSANPSYAIAVPDGIVGHDNVPFMFRALDNSGNPLYDLGGNPLFNYAVFDKTTATFIIDMPNAPGYYTIPCGTPGDDLTPFATYRGVTSNGTPLFNLAVYDNTTAYFVVHQDAAPGYFLQQMGTAGADNTPFILWSGNQVPGLQFQGGTPVVYAVYNHTTAMWSGTQTELRQYWTWFPFSFQQGVPGHNNTPFISPNLDQNGVFTYDTGPASQYNFGLLVYDHNTATFYTDSGTVQVGNSAHNNVPNLIYNGVWAPTGTWTYMLEVYDTNTAIFTDQDTYSNQSFSAADGIVGHSNTPFLLTYPTTTSASYPNYAYAHVVYDADISTFIVVAGPGTVLYPNQPYYTVQIGTPGH